MMPQFLVVKKKNAKQPFLCKNQLLAVDCLFVSYWFRVYSHYIFLSPTQAGNRWWKCSQKTENMSRWQHSGLMRWTVCHLCLMVSRKIVLSKTRGGEGYMERFPAALTHSSEWAESQLGAALHREYPSSVLDTENGTRGWRALLSSKWAVFGEGIMSLGHLPNGLLGSSWGRGNAESGNGKTFLGTNQVEI